MPDDGDADHYERGNECESRLSRRWRGKHLVRKMQAHSKAQQPILRPGVGGVAHWEGVV